MAEPVTWQQTWEIFRQESKKLGLLMAAVIIAHLTFCFWDTGVITGLSAFKSVAIDI